MTGVQTCALPIYTVFPPAIIGGAHQPGYPGNTRPETYYGQNAGLTEILIPAGYVSTAYDPVYKLSADGKRYEMAHSDTPTQLSAPGLPFSLVFRVEPGKEDISLNVAAAYEAASLRRVPPPAFPPLHK